jgi:hypothetical protein
MKEMIRYLLMFDMFLGIGASTIAQDFNPFSHTLSINVDFERQSSLVGVKSSPNGEGIHQILWSHELKRLIDPLCPETHRDFADYEIVECWPVVKMTGAI